MTIGAGVVVIVLVVIVVMAVNAARSSSPAHPAAADVGSVTCGRADDAGVWQATVRVTNHSSKISTYVMTIEWDDALGTRLASSPESFDAVAPGRSATDDVTTEAPAAGGTPATCKAANVTRVAS